MIYLILSTSVMDLFKGLLIVVAIKISYNRIKLNIKGILGKNIHDQTAGRHERAFGGSLASD